MAKGSAANLAIDGERLWGSLMEMSKIGSNSLRRRLSPSAER